MGNKRKLLSAAVMMACGSVSTQTQAALAPDAILQAVDGVYTCIGAGTYPSCSYGTDVTSGSYFSMDTSGDGKVQKTEKTAVTVKAGVILGIVQPATGSHSGAINGSEKPGIDIWEFFGNTGMHNTTAPITISSDNGAGNITLDFAGWDVTWNGIGSIPMGGDTANFPGDTGIAIMTCAVDCAVGDTYTLDYASHVPKGDISGFGGVGYALHLEGVVAEIAPPTTDAAGVNPGALGLGIRLTMSDIVGLGQPDDVVTPVPTAEGSFIGYTYPGGIVDFIIPGGLVGGAAQVVIPQYAPIPADLIVDTTGDGMLDTTYPVVYRKLIAGVWTDFVVDASNFVDSAASVAGVCPVPGDAAYTATGLVAGNDCVQLTIQDGGPNDADVIATQITDPGGVAVANVIAFDYRKSSTNGCSMTTLPVNNNERADWWLVAGFIALLGFFRLKRSRN